jgi:hypothetical protein
MKTKTVCRSALPAAGPDDPDESDRRHNVARAWRLRAVHAQDTDHTCGLCLCAWPCQPREWADQTLHDAHLVPAELPSPGLVSVPDLPPAATRPDLAACPDLPARSGLTELPPLPVSDLPPAS